MAAAHVLLALGVVLVCCEVVGALFQRAGQPKVIGEIAAGLALGPIVLGAVAPAAERAIFPAVAIGALKWFGEFGVVLLMLEVGLSLQHPTLRRTSPRIAIVGAANVALPFAAGAALATWLWPRYSGGRGGEAGFVLLVGVAMAVTAFPVLARILRETGLDRTALGGQALMTAAVSDGLAWVLLAAASGLATGKGAGHALVVLLELAGITVGWLLVSRPLFLRLAPGIGLVAASAVLLAAATEAIGAHAIFGAFLAGVAVPRTHAQALERQLAGPLKSLLLPVFFASAALDAHAAFLWTWHNIGVLALCLLVAAGSKLGGTTLTSRLAGESWRDAATMGVLMNTRGLTELVVLVVGLDLSVLSPSLYDDLVVMALLTTAATAPLLRLLGVVSRERAETPLFGFRRSATRLDLPDRLDTSA